MVHDGRDICFGPFRLDVAGARLWRGEEPVAIQPRPLAVLAHLAARPGEVVARDELIATLWAGTYVTRAVLKVAVRAVREALGDDADAPRFIETVGREGYRFIGGEAGPAAAPVAAPGAVGMVGRTPELSRLHAALARARGGQRAIVLVSGEAGVGKTTLLDRFAADVRRAGDVAVARGQCLEQYGEGEAYLPVLEALGDLARAERDGSVAAAIARHAPSWVPHLAALAPDAPARAPGGAPLAATPARMLREMADALAVLTRDRPLLLVLEDLQWSDRSSIDLLQALALRRDAARLCVVGTVRSGDPTVHAHPVFAVGRELVAKGLGEELALGLLSGDDVAAWLCARFTGAPDAAVRRLAADVHARTEGNGLFMVNVVNDLVARGVVAWRDGRWHVDEPDATGAEHVPAGLQALLGRRMQALAPAVREILEAASVAGAEFTAAAVAAAAGTDVERVEDVCEQLAAQGALLAETGVAEWPDGTVSGRYRFRHALYRRVLYEGVAAARRVRLHRAVGTRTVTGLGTRADEHAAELAVHFARGHAHARARHFHEVAAAAALERHAVHEAVAHWTAALDALARTPDAPDRLRDELRLVVARATLLMASAGYAAPATEEAFARARALCTALPDDPAIHPVLRGLVSFHNVRAELALADALGAELLQRAAAHPDDVVLRVQAHYGIGANAFHAGALVDARRHLEAARRDYDPATHREHVAVYGGYDPGVACALWLAWTALLQGRVDEATALTREGLALAQRHGEVFTLAWAWHGVGVSEQFLGDWPASERASAEAVRLAEEHGFPHVLGMATANHGLARVMCGNVAAGIAMLRDGVALVERTGAALVRPSYLAMLAAAHALEHDRDAALARIDEALAEMDRTGERAFEAAVLIQKSLLLSTRGADGRGAAEACLRRALAVAQAQGALLLALRAAVALVRQADGPAREAEARALLAAAHAPFADAAAVLPDVAAARRVLGPRGGP